MDVFPPLVNAGVYAIILLLLSTFQGPCPLLQFFAFFQQGLKYLLIIGQDNSIGLGVLLKLLHRV